MKSKINQSDSLKHNQLEYFYASLTKSELEIVTKLTDIIKLFSNLEEKISYSVLYYFQNSRVCFIWPASIKPGPKSGVQFGFCNGYLLDDPKNILEREKRKQVYCLTFHSTDEIDKNTLIAFIENAIRIDETIYQKKKR
ncbi:DUF1801 domain-containing protein [Leptospira levettii]|uniref:DUF1801 domain-containing protein n=1 Tax=Leptospira levettii TaxID=2023178 RepID=A0A5F2D9T6_9LEPT|nr:DUF1801 domain-containing protein [Leptospira levettii]PKA25464.1 hypothetical protein CH381_15625 [Leptospira sp. mixed culture ATI2-C-A1]MCW7465007.1 DUF1801 domain-containing protein [Leptospira levettii]MCW7510809.1 DUF1801 domain-containing protein [Leptospira levettii]MCW7514563.1 DUF1801 domain-containing protein [Leptospira levettii]TGL73406.1 DUF1801 domain-containing protein [Leptospira levettii]